MKQELIDKPNKNWPSIILTFLLFGIGGLIGKHIGERLKLYWEEDEKIKS